VAEEEETPSSEKHSRRGPAGDAASAY